MSAPWPDRDVVRVAGPDAAPFLQGQLSQDLSGLAVGGATWSFVLEPQGKVDAFMRVRRAGDDEFLLDTDAGWGERLVARLSRFKLRTKADIELLGAGEIEVPVPTAQEWPGLDPWSERARIEAGFPRMGAEADGSTIPNELGPHVIVRAVSFTKGCYTGQELVARVDSRGGNVPRHLRHLRADAAVPAGAALVDGGGKEVGRVTSATSGAADDGGSGGTVALAFVARSVEVPASLEASWEGGRATVEVRALSAAS